MRRSRAQARARRAGGALVLAATLAAAGCSAQSTVVNPLAGTKLAVVPAAAAIAAKAEAVSGDAADARLTDRLAGQPTASWMTGGSPAEVEAKVRAVVTAAAGRTAVLVAYDVPGRDCGSYSTGGAADAAGYAAWVAGFAAGLGQAPAVVVLEPDAVAQTLPQGDCATLSAQPAASTRRAELAAAVTTLAGDADAHVYLDAGNVGFIQDVPALAAALRDAGVGKAAGFALNVSSFYSNADSTAYGLAISAQLDGAHFVIDTSRNGNGPYVAAAGDTEPVWCNPPGRRLGTAPTTSTGTDHLDAYLWVKIPGASDGTCRGGPAAGAWWPAYALALVRDSG